MKLPFTQSTLEQGFAALRRDLLHAGGPRISTMRNYRFAILQYDPEQEFEQRRHVQQLTRDLSEHGWFVLSISLQRLLLDRLRAQEDDWKQIIIESERNATRIHGRARGLKFLKDEILPILDESNGLADDCAAIIQAHVKRHPEHVDRTLALIGRAGPVYPFFRTSALLRNLDGHTEHVPVVLLYPGHREGATGLSFMGELTAASDYRPRIYP